MAKNRAIMYRVLRYPIKLLLKIIYNPKTINKHFIPKTGPIVIAGNHKHDFDPLLICNATKRTCFFMSKIELHQGKFRHFFKSVGTIPVDRAIHDDTAKSKAVEILEEGKVLGIFPEGTRNKTKEIVLPFKFGAVSFAKKTNALVVPFAITGEYTKFKNTLQVRFAKPIDVSNMSLEEANKLLQDTVEKMLVEDNKNK